MKKKTMRPALALAAMTLAVAAAAQQTATQAVPKVEPGLWEIKIALKSESGKIEAAVKLAQAQIAMLPEGQRKEVEQMMAERGVRLSNDASTVQACISKEDAERGQIPVQAGDCTQQVLDRNGPQLTVKFACTTQPPANGTATINFQGPRAYTSTGIVDTVVAGAPERLNVDQAGRWLATDCGNVRPLGR